MRSLIVVSAGLSTPSSSTNLATQISGAVSSAVTARGEAVDITRIELSEVIPDLGTFLSTGIATERIDALRSQISAADGMIAVTPVFKASYSGLFKVFFDILEPEALVDMPVIIAATGGHPAALPGAGLCAAPAV